VNLPGTDELKRHVDAALDDFLALREAELPSDDERVLVGEVARVVRAGGKRLRPAFCYWGYRSAGGDQLRPIVAVAASLELLHTFAIVHDDVMDASPLRRGEPTVHVRLAGEHGSGRINSSAQRFGESAAVLVGDLAFVFADELFLTSGFEPDALARGTAWYSAMRREVIGGQFLDLLAAHRGGASSHTSRRIASLKSGGYTVEKPLLIGASLAGADDETLERLSAYGRPLGEAFQLRDDVLGTFGEPGETGKDADGDLLEGKQTVLVALARERADAQTRAFLDASLGRRDLSADDVERLRRVLIDTGALDETNELIAELTDRALGVAATFEGAVGDALAELAHGAAVRRE
jgi:geranylgeranyl diphosphate synthase type I